MKVLIIQIRQLGDILLSSPLGRVIKESIKGVEVHFLTSEIGRDILTGNPFIDKILVIKNGIKSEWKTILQVRKEQYDAIIDVQRTGRSKRITLLSGAPLKVAFKRKKENFYYNRLIEWKNHGYTVWERMELLRGLDIKFPVKKYLPQIYLSKEEIEKGRKLVKDLGLNEKDFFIVVPTSRRMKRAWQPEKFGILATYLSKHTGLKPLIAYAPGEEAFAKQALNHTKDGTILENPLSIRLFASLIHQSAFLLGNDSFASHLSLSLGKKTIVIVGPNEGWFPNINLVVKVRKNLSCQPCGNWKKCDKNMACYIKLSPEEAFRQIVNFL